MFICGEFNIDLLNPNTHKMTEELTNSMYSMTLYPLITRPNRIMAHCATPINNIFTNHMECSLVSGLLMNDISDRLPVFVDYAKLIWNYKTNRRKITDETNAFRTQLLSQNWNTIYGNESVNAAYEIFLEIFTSLYDKNCPIIQCNSKNKKLHRQAIDHRRAAQCL